MREMPTLSSSRLILRTMRETDTPHLDTALSDWETMRTMSPTHWPPIAEPGSAAYTRWQTKLEQDMAAFFWIICPKEKPQTPIGYIYLTPGDKAGHDQRGFLIFRPHWMQGYATEAAQVATDFFFNQLGYETMLLRSAKSNLASHNLKKRQGAKLIKTELAEYSGGLMEREYWILEKADFNKAYPQLNQDSQ